jgi:predicted DNA-binding transcriptional regulator AlpA
MGEPQKQVHAEDDRLLSFEETQQRYGRTRGTLYNWLKDSELNFPRPKTIGRSKYFSLKELLAYESAAA